MAIATAKEKFTIKLPDTDGDDVDMESEEWQDFKTMLEMNRDKHGVKSLLNHIYYYNYHMRHVSTQWKALLKSANVVNGIRTPSQKTGDKSRSLKRTAKKFYESLNTAGLKMQCSLFNIDYDSYDDQESIITALVEKHVEMAG